jgi:type I restriction enzyme S subunit
MSKWPSESLSRLGTIVTGSTPRTSEVGFYGGEIPFVTPVELDQFDPITQAQRTLSEAGSGEARLVPTGAVLVCCIGSLGKVGIAGCTIATNQQINSIVFNIKLVWPRYGYYARRLLKAQLEHMAPATTVAIVSKSKFEKLEIPLPPLEEQQRIALMLDKANDVRQKRRQALQQLDKLRLASFYELIAIHLQQRANGRLGDLVICSRKHNTERAQRRDL